ncbi:MAG TPA: arginine--tRNA ligase, partial [Vicingus sp.]|nr:arginine--tRNA ligase [Vicingus sp.]
MENTIAQKVVEAIQSLYQQNIESKLAQPQKTKKEFTGDLTVVVFPFLQASKKSPEKTAQEIGEYLLRNIEQIEDFNVVKGFLNLSISASYWVETFQKINENQQFGFSSNSGKTYMVEYSSPNTNKPLHLGHLRNNFLGYSVAEILKANGHEVFKTQIINDRGIHICKSMLAWQKFGNGETPQSSGLKGDHLVGKYYVEFDKAYKKEIETLVNAGKDKEIAEREAPIFLEAQAMLLKWEEGDKDVVELWKTMNGWVYEGFDVTYKTMGVDFDELYYESDTYILGKDVVEKGLEKGVFYQKPDGSIWCDLSAEKMDDKLLLRADGTSVYMTQDIGTAIERYKKH